MKVRGFILQATYRVRRDGAHGPVPVIHLYGALPGGGSFLVRDDRQRPFFYLRTSGAPRARALGAPDPQVSQRSTFGGEPVSRIEMPIPADVPALRQRLHEAGIETFEADVRFAIRYLIERGIKGGCEIEGPAVRGDGVTWVFDNPTVTPAEVALEPRVLAFDIETDPRGTALLAISLYADSGALDEVLIVDGAARPMPERATACADEREALDAFCARVAAFDPDVLTGWNTIDFDLTVLQRIAARLRHPLPLGREPGPIRVRKAEGYFGSGQASIPGRLALDGLDLLRGAFVRMEDYSLDAVAREILGEGKAVKGDARDRVAEIMHNYSHDLDAFALYARTDARLAHDIVARLKLVELAVERSRLTGMTPDRVAASIASFDFLYLSELERLAVVAPTVQSSDSRVHAAQQGGHVLEPRAGLHENVWVLDFKSLYPSIIRTFNIDPLSYVPAPERGADLIATPAAAFRREPAILPRMLDELFPRRDAARRDGNAVAANAIKILMNSFYGVLGTPACRFSNPALANAITGLGREMLLWSKRWFEAKGYEVLYGDTDSLFVLSGGAEPAVAQGQALARALSRDLARHIDAQWRVTSRLELRFEKLSAKLFLPHARHSARGASKRYAGLLHGTGEVEFVGMEVVRRDWTTLARDVQRELYRRLFTDEPVAEYLREVVARVRSGAVDAALVYRKQLRKPADEYTRTTPPHVAAARKAAETAQRGTLISYVMTRAGAEPADDLRHPLDREHYVQKQVRPVAEPVLEALGLDFDRAIGDARQLDLLLL